MARAKFHGMRIPVALLSAFLAFGVSLPTETSASWNEAAWQDIAEDVLYVEFHLDPNFFLFRNIILGENDEWPIDDLDLNPAASVFGRVRIVEIRQALTQFASDFEEGRAWLNLLWNDGTHRHTVLASEVGEVLAQYLYPIIENDIGERLAMSLVAQNAGWNVSGVRFWEELRRRIEIVSIPFPPTPSEAWLAA